MATELTLLINADRVQSQSLHKRALIFTRRYSDFISRATLLTLDTTFFVSKVAFKKDNPLSEGTLVALSAIGFCALPYTGDLIRKTVCDSIFGYRAGNAKVAIIAALRVIELVNNLGLLGCNLAASILGFEGETASQTSLYRAVTPWGESMLVLGMVLNLAFMYVNYQTLKVLDRVDEVPLFQAFKTPNAESHHAAALRFSMDKDTLGVLLTKIDETAESQALMNIVKANLKTEQKVHLVAKFALSVVGYALMGVEKYFTPNSLVSASINLAVGVLYNGFSFIKYMREYRQRANLNKL